MTIGQAGRGLAYTSEKMEMMFTFCRFF